MNKIVTGAAGFIGSHLCKNIGSSAVKVDPANEKMLTPEQILFELKQKVKAFDCLYHLGAVSSTTENDIAKLTQNNILFSCELLNICIEKKIPFIYASSASVYGLGNNGFKETVQLEPLNYYAISKAAFDMYALQKIIDNPEAKIVGLRYFNVYGKNEEHKKDMASPVHKFIQQAKITGKINIFEGSENFVRDFIHSDDVVNATIAAREFKSGIYNIGTGHPRSFRDVADIVARHLDAEIIEIPFPKHLVGKYQKYTRSDNNNIDTCGYTTSRICLEAGIRKVIGD